MLSRIIILFAFIASLLLSCKPHEESNPRITWNSDSTIKSKDYKLKNGEDSSVGYSYFPEKSIQGLIIAKARGRELYYTDNCRFDQYGNRIYETYFDGEGKVVRHYTSRKYDQELKKNISEDEIHKTPEGKVCGLYISWQGENLVELSFSGITSKSFIQHYDENGKIKWIKTLDLTEGTIKLIHFDTPESKATFNDTLLRYAREMQQKIKFPSGNKTP